MSLLEALALLLPFLITAYTVNQPQDEVRLSEASILLPFGGDFHKLQAFNGCFIWTINNPSLAELEPVGECNKQVKIRARSISPSLGRQSTFLIAEDRYTGRKLKCELFFDKIEKIEIVTTTRLLYKGDVVALEAAGYDAEGNIFSSLETFVFNWFIKPEKEDSTPILQLVTFKEAKIEASPALTQMESKGKQSSVVLVRGIDTGVVKVTAQLEPSTITTQLVAEVVLSVMEPIQLFPQDIYIVKDTEVQFQLQTFRKDAIFNIELPSNLFYWVSKNSEVASIDNSGRLKALKLGHSRILAQYTDMKENYAASDVFVVEVDSLGLEAIPIPDEKNVIEYNETNIHKWFLVKDRQYKLIVVAFEKSAHKKIYVTDAINFKVSLDNCFDTLTKSKNNGVLTVLANKQASSAYIEVSLFDGSKQYRQPLQIVAPVSIDKHVVILPYDTSVIHKIHLNVDGGSKYFPYIWKSKDTTVATVVTSDATAMVSGENLGEATIRCEDSQNPNNFDKALVRVAHPHKLRFLHGNYETPIGKVLTLVVAAFDKSDTMFSNCSALKITWNITDTNILDFVPDSLGQPDNGCVSRAFVGKEEGQTVVIARYASLSVHVTIVVFKNMKISEKRIVVTLGSSYTIGISGGPIPYPLDQTKHYENLIPLKEPSFISIQHRRYRPSGTVGAGWRLYTLTCLRHGTQKILVEVGNNATDLNPHPARSQEEIIFSCQPPRALWIYPTGEPVEENACAESMGYLLQSRLVKSSLPQTTGLTYSISDHTLARVPMEYKVRNNRQLEFNLVLFDGDGYLFHNFSSIAVRWNSHNTTLASLGGEIQSDFSGFDVAYISTNFVHQRKLTLSNNTGNVNIDVSVTGFDDTVLAHAQVISREPSWLPFKRSFTFALYQKLHLLSDTESVYLHPDNIVQLPTIGGSGHYKTELNGTAAEIVVEEAKTLSVKPLAGGLAHITIRDACLDDVSRADVFISDIRVIQLKSLDAIQHQESIQMTIQVLDSRGGVISPVQYKLIDFLVHVDNVGILNVVQEGRLQPEILTVRGLEVGSSSITVTTKTHSDNLVSSGPFMIHVFPKFQLRPNTLILVPDAEYQIKWRGGPPLRTELEFELDSKTLSGGKDIATINKNTGLVTAHHVGTQRVTATMTSYHPTEAEKRRIGQDYTTVSVKYLEGIRIISSTSRVFVGNEVLLRVTGSQGEPASSWGNLDVQFKWESQNSRISKLEPFCRNSNLALDDESSFIVRAKCISSGRTTISVRVTKAPVSTNLQDMASSFSISCVDPLKLLSPPEILMAPGSHFQIRTNYDLDPLKVLKYQILSDDTAGSVRVSETGLITAANAAGSAILLISVPSDGSSHGRSAILSVHIKPINDIVLEAVPKCQAEVLVGSSHEYDIGVIDDLGTPFNSFNSVSFASELNVEHKVGITLSHTPNNTQNSRRPLDETPVFDNPKLTVHGLASGSSILKLQTSILGGRNIDARDLSLEVPLRVRNALTPSNVTIHIGGEVQFSTSLPPDPAYRRPWSSSNPKVLSINPETGLAEAHMVGKVTVYHNASVSTFSSVSVVRAVHVVLKPQILKFTKPQSSFHVAVPVECYDQADGTLLVNKPGIKQNINLKCSLDGSAQLGLTSFSVTEGNTTYCTIFYSDALQPLLTKLKTPPILRAIVSDKAGSYHVDAFRPVSFFPIFILKEQNIRLTEDKGPYYVQLTWSEKMEPENKKKLDVISSESQLIIKQAELGDPLPTDKKINDTTDYFSVALTSGKHTPFLNQKVVIQHRETGQQQEFTVSFDPAVTENGFLKKDHPKSDSWSNFFLYLVLAILLFCVLPIYLCFTYTDQPLPVNPSPPGSLFTTPTGGTGGYGVTQPGVTGSGGYGPSGGGYGTGPSAFGISGSGGYGSSGGGYGSNVGGSTGFTGATGNFPFSGYPSAPSTNVGFSGGGSAPTMTGSYAPYRGPSSLSTSPTRSPYSSF